MHRDAWRQEHNVDERRTTAGVRPVNDDAVGGHQQVVGAEVGMQQRRSARVGGPSRLQYCQIIQAGTRPRVEALIAGSLGQDAPAGEVRAKVLPDGGCADGRGRQRVCEPVERTEDLTDLPVFPWQGRMLAVDVIEDQREPRTVIGGCPQPRRRQPPGPDQWIKLTEDPGFLPMQARCVGIRLA